MAVEEAESGEGAIVPLRTGAAARARDWVAILVMLASAPLMALIFTAMSPVLQLIAAHFGADHKPAIAIPALGLAIDGTLYAQLITTIPSIGLILGGAPAGFAIDRWGARAVLLAALVAYGVVGSAGLYLDEAVPLLASRLALGFAAVAYGTATVWLIGARFVGDGRARALSYRNLLGGVGAFFSTILAGQLGERGGWHSAFGLYLAALLLIPVALYAIDPTPPANRGRDATRAPKEPLLFLWPLYLLVVLLAIVMMMNTAQLAFLLADNGIRSPKLLSRVIVVGSVMSMAGAAVYSVWGPRLDARRNYTVIAAALGSGVVVMGLSHDPVATAIGTGLTGFGAGYMGPHFGRMVLDRAPAAARGRAVGLNFSAIYFGDLVNPFVVRPIAAALGIHRAFVIIGGIVVASALQIVVPAAWLRRVFGGRPRAPLAGGAMGRADY